MTTQKSSLFTLRGKKKTIAKGNPMSKTAVLLVILYAVLSLGVCIYTWTLGTTPRRERMKIPVVINFSLSVALLAVSLFWPNAFVTINVYQPGHTEIFTLMLLVLLFALTLEIPGFLLNFAFDKRAAELLAKNEEALLAVRFSPTSDNRAKFLELAKSNSGKLENNNIEKLILRCAKGFDSIQNVDSGMASVLLNSIDEEQRRISERSKHPFSEMLQVLSLSAVALLLGEILAHLKL
jgi:hypothetical protein